MTLAFEQGTKPIILTLSFQVFRAMRLCVEACKVTRIRASFTSCRVGHPDVYHDEIVSQVQCPLVFFLVFLLGWT